MDEQRKRKGSPTSASPDSKKQKKQQQWRAPKKSSPQYAASIEPGDAGIWATCARGKEGKSTFDLRDLFQDYAGQIYPALSYDADAGGNVEDLGADIEASISAEVTALTSSKAKSTGQDSLFQPVKLDTPCVLFFKTTPPIEPGSLVSQICADKAAGHVVRGCRFVKRLTPMTRMGRATPHSLDEVCEAVLTEAALGPPESGRKYAIRPTIRDHNVMKRDEIIELVARKVGKGYVVDLKKPSVVVLVEVYRNMLGMSVVQGGEFERLKRYNLAEIEGPRGEDRDESEATIARAEVDEGREATMVGIDPEDSEIAADE